ncbi:MAG TPA: trypsin-like serine protease, partial [Chloroflexi bacterium]|nr:trypsin-like serine protease [Chloroflexota bacterium]
MSWRRGLMISVVLLVVASVYFASGLSSGVEEVTAIVVWEGAAEGDPYAYEGITRNVSADLPAPEAVTPLPIPEWHPPRQITQPENRVVMYDVISKTEQVIEIPMVDGPLAQFVEGGVGARSDQNTGDTRSPRNFGGLSRIDNPEDYPWCVNVKLYMRWGSTWYVGSGVLIDPLHVLTAGHCVHEGSGGAWADEVIVVPAYENGVRPYGDARAVNLYSWTGWTQDGNFDHDMGLIQLDRPVGALTGWHGYGYNADCSFYTDPSRTWYNPGYPAEYPYTGEYMYWWYGYFDQCETYGAWFNQHSYGGQSGSGAYYIDGGNRYVHLVLSAGTDSWTWDVRMTPTKFGHIRDNWIGGNTPGTFDLIPLDVQVSPETINCGNQLSSMSYVVHNYSSASWSGTVTVKVYLSTNDNISTYDTLIQIHQFSYNFGPKSSVRVNVTTPPTIPSGISSGTYWIGIILDISDYNTGNNDSDGQDAATLTVNCLPDLYDDGEAYRSFSPTTVCAGVAGQSFEIHCDIRNGGSGDAGPFKVKFYASTNTTITTYDYYIGTVNMSGIAAGDWANCDWSGTFPTSIPAGTYYIGWIIDADDEVAESDENNNTAYKQGYQLKVYGGPPPVPTGVTASDGTYSDRVRVTWNSVGDATRYDVYRAQAGCGTYTKIGEATTTTYDDFSVVAGKVYWYRVKACNPCGCSGYSNSASGYAGSPAPGTSATFRVERSTGNVYTDGAYHGQCYYSGSADVAEWVPVREPVEPGDVLEIDPENPGHYRKARGPCSSLVAGVVSTEPGFVLGHGEDTEGKVLLALMGIVPVKVADEGGPI